ncbi:organomercurial lyase [Subtercola frigoramans]|uniref:Alkylmercury lyase n=1 Tax=Subtercola frigoramans TaxID=120298 RepID=A0ABS2L5C6_9MICO|nr:organomercurial lyase [Subtercola frigoramans]MBM7472262.1 hypothetical protein [Subtercola frigoramans]
MTDIAELTRLMIYHGFASTGVCPSRQQMSAQLVVPPAAIDSAMNELQEQRHIAVDDRGEVVLAHPFCSVNLGFSVMGRETLWWGGCAWDSFAIPHLILDEPSVLVATTCPGCGAAHAWIVGTVAPPAGEQLAHFLVPTARIWDDVVHTCANQRIFCGEECIDRWLLATGNERGSVFDLATLWRLAEHWYEGRLGSPYARREPSEAKAYFQSVGLHGAFWGTEPLPEKEGFDYSI